MDSQMALKKLQATELEILLVINDFCQQHDITWFLEGGSALGAARHNGFIPWDDDVDIAMVREDYDRFCRLAHDELPKGYSLHTSRDTTGFAALFVKVYKDGTRFENLESREAGLDQGIFVDVFPYDRLPSDTTERNRMIRKASLAQRLSYLYHAKSVTIPHTGILGSVERLACRVVHFALRALVHDGSYFQDTFDRAMMSSRKTVSDDCLSLVWPNMDPIDVGRLLPVSTASFEGHVLPVPHDLEFYLENMYGDWRRVPKPEDRHTHLPLLIDFGDGCIWESESA